MKKVFFCIIACLLAICLVYLAINIVSGNKSPLAKAARSIINPTIKYDASYQLIPYPMGDVNSKRGCCTDVVIRAYRKIGVDLQQLVHEDRKSQGIATDTNIDHRRVANLMTFFSRHGTVLPVTHNPKDYQSGNIVCWDLDGQLHIGIVSDLRTISGFFFKNQPKYMIIHNMGALGQIPTEWTFSSKMKIVGHYSYPK